MAPYIDSSLPPSGPSALTTFISASAPASSAPSKPPTTAPLSHHFYHLALQIQHNLHHQHTWSSLHLHTHSATTHPPPPLPRPLLSGLPPRRLYIHPDEQISLLKRKVKDEDIPTEREWVVPSHVNEKWTLRQFAEVFDAIGRVPPELEGEGEGEGDGKGGGFDAGRDDGWTKDVRHGVERGGEGDRGVRRRSDVLDGRTQGQVMGQEKAAASRNKWREMQPKRVLLATVCDDSTIVYYIIHDGLVKPRQN